jgi:hypothetical protein
VNRLFVPRCAALLASFLISWQVGCASREEAAQEVSTLKPLVILYGQYVGQHRGQPPASEAEFKKFVESQGADTLRSFGVADADDLWVSPRDGQPYVVLYGPVAGPPGPGGQPVVAYESVGVGGKRYVASSLGAVEEVDEARFRELVPGAK